MFVAHTIAIVIRDGAERERVTSYLEPLNHEILSAASFDEIEAQTADPSRLSLALVDRSNAENCVERLAASRNGAADIHFALLALLPADVDAAPYLERGFADVLRESVSQPELLARLQTHLQLRESAHQHFRALLEHTPVGIFRLTTSGELTAANPAFLKMLGYTSFSELRAAAKSHMRSPFPPPEPSVSETVWMRRDGSPIQVLQRTLPVFSSNGDLLYLEGMIEDLTQRQLMEEALKDHAARLTLALDAARMGDFEYNFRRDEIDCAYLVYRLLGYEDEPAVRSSEVLLERVHPDDVKSLRESLRGAINEDSTWQHEFRVVWPDETTHWIVARGEVMRGDDDEPERLIGVVRDATPEKKLRLDLIAAKQEAENMAEVKSVFLANMSHEIRTPLTAIIGFASLLATRVSEEHQRAVMRIQQGGQRLLDTLNAVLTLARLESSQLTLDVQPVDILSEARATLRMFERQAREKGLRLGFSTSVTDRNVHAVVDRGAFASILQNLIGNAIKFTDEGHVQVIVEEARRDGRLWLWVRVRDTGRGIDKTFLPHIFEEFRQESTGLRREYEGAGLGLAIVRRLTEILGGKLIVDSAPGEGSTFSVRFPATIIEPPPEEPVAAATPRSDDEARPHLMVVEDNADTRELLQALLEDRFDVTLTGSAREAVMLAEDQVFDLVLMDINLGEGPNGEEVAGLLRDLPAYREVPIIALTAYALPGDAERFLSKGFSAHLPKPFRPPDLFALIDRLDGSSSS